MDSQFRKMGPAGDLGEISDVPFGAVPTLLLQAVAGAEPSPPPIKFGSSTLGRQREATGLHHLLCLGRIIGSQDKAEALLANPASRGSTIALEIS